MTELSIEYLRQILSYDSQTGAFKWNKTNRKKVGIIHRGYLRIQLNKKKYMAHRLAWAIFYGEWPVHDIDHINRITLDNRIDNLRQATKQQNNQNTKTRKDNSSGYKGVSVLSSGRRRYRADISINGKNKYIGVFFTPEEARDAYIAEAKLLHGEFFSDGK